MAPKWLTLCTPQHSEPTPQRICHASIYMIIIHFLKMYIVLPLEGLFFTLLFNICYKVYNIVFYLQGYIFLQYIINYTESSNCVVLTLKIFLKICCAHFVLPLAIIGFQHVKDQSQLGEHGEGGIPIKDIARCGEINTPSPSSNTLLCYNETIGAVYANKRFTKNLNPM